MIINFPTKYDFFGAANDYLNLSWESVIELLSEFEGIRDEIDEESHEEERIRYWNSSRQTLISATALVQQAVEFYIKGRIADVSPYLLISGSPQHWPKGSAKNDVEFSSFRTLDSHDLLKVHDTVCNKKFSSEFIQWFDDLRVIRNKVMHTIDKTLNVNPEDVVSYILFAHNYFSDSKTWLKSRRSYLEKSPVYSVKLIQDEDSEPYILDSLLG